ncbi:hypothetical protein P171DRAFT_430303, partial [Karstenula rhodostoma CBS 690.94]
MIDKSGHGETKHFMSHDHVLHIEPELYKAEILDGDTWWDRRHLYRHTLKVSELLGVAAPLLPQLQHVEVELRIYSWSKILMTHLETTYKDGIIWIDKHDLNDPFEHDFSR